MTLQMAASGTATIILIASSPIIVSVLLAIPACMYFITMTKINAIDKKYNGSWRQYFKSILLYLKKKPK